MKRIIPIAVDIAYKSVRRRERRKHRGRRGWKKVTGWKITLSDVQRLQIGIL